MNRGSIRYNLKHWVSILLWILVISPFILLHVIAEDALDYFASDFNFLDVMFACGLVFPVFMTIALNAQVAMFCARDKNRVDDTIRMARDCSVITGLILIVGLALYIWHRLST